VSGKVELFDGVAQMVHPDHVLPPEEADDAAAFEPVYPLTAGVTQKTMFKAAHRRWPGCRSCRNGSTRN
jgi:ATP-dependent DNA helicase RecG